MAWKCLDEYCSYKIYTISDEFSVIVERILDFFLSFSASFYVVLVFLALAGFLTYMFWYISQIVGGQSI